MLKLENITKEYYVGDNVIHALRGISIEFRKSEFVAVLGHSGCGKTTLLNIIGGLDRYTAGKMTIAARPTENFAAADWDAYRNHSVGFVFQTYNLIPHQTVLSNVELALTLSGVGRRERRQRALEALDRVGLKDHAYKKPNQMSGGQMQRVAIARALVNDPEILLADEPTGALDSETSVQIMDILKEVAKDRLVIMVTHNPELADAYATRIVRLSDGLITADSDPYDGKDENIVADASRQKHTTMSFFTALSLSFNNLMTKKGRTILTAFAGSIGIIGIALILALSNGIHIFIDDTQESTLSSYPIILNAEEADMSTVIEAMVGSRTEAKDNADDRVYVSAVMYDLVNSYNSMEMKTNDLKAFKAYLDEHFADISSDVSMIQYGYDAPVNIYVRDRNGDFSEADILAVFSAMTDGSSMSLGSSLSSNLMSGFSSYSVWEEMLPGEGDELVHSLVRDQYTLLWGDWPKADNELVLFLDENNEITDITLYALGLMTSDEMIANMIAARDGKRVEMQTKEYSFEEILGREFRLVLNADYFADSDGDGVWSDVRSDKDALELVVNAGVPLKISGVVKSDSSTRVVSGSLGYTSALVQRVMAMTAEKKIVKDQQSEAYANKDIFTGLPFEAPEADEPTDDEKAAKIVEYFASLTNAEKREMYLAILSEYDDAALDAQTDAFMENYDTREKLEEMIIQSFASVDPETAREQLAGISDEDLASMVRKAVKETLIQQIKTAAEKTVQQAAETPSAEELELLSARFSAAFDTKEKKLGYIFADYRAKTTLPDATIQQYLYSLSDADLDAVMQRLAGEYAEAHYAENAAFFAADPDAKVAAAFDAYVAALPAERLPALYDAYMPSGTAPTTLADNLRTLGVADPASPASIRFYVSTFDKKDNVAAFIDAYNKSTDEDHAISYTDYVGLIMSSVTVIIDAISYVLIAFVGVSLVVSSIMIGIITYISVLERTKEIGILRAIGASKRDVSRVFNAETLVIGFTAGVFGIAFSALAIIPINAIIRALSGLEEIGAVLPLAAALILVAISMFLTLVAGLIPSRLAAKKDPVIALRSE